MGNDYDTNMYEQELFRKNGKFINDIIDNDIEKITQLLYFGADPLYKTYIDNKYAMGYANNIHMVLLLLDFIEERYIDNEDRVELLVNIYEEYKNSSSYECKLIHDKLCVDSCYHQQKQDCIGDEGGGEGGDDGGDCDIKANCISRCQNDICKEMYDSTTSSDDS